MSTFLGRDAVFWAGIEALAVCIYTFVVVVTGLLIYRQVRAAAMTFRLGAAQRLQELVDVFRTDRQSMFQTFPLEMVMGAEQFPQEPPRRVGARPRGLGDAATLGLTEQQAQAIESLSEEQRETARRVVGKLNDIGELIESGTLEQRAFLGKYHVMVIQCCHMLEAFRREEERRRGGNYGQRLLRMRQWAINYNDASPKHREMPISVTNGVERRMVYRSPPGTRSQRLTWFMRRYTGRYA